MKYKYRLVENEEPTTPDGEETGGSSRENVEYELVLTPLAISTDEVVKALEDVNNYGAYTSNLRNTKSNVDKALVAHFGPSQRYDKLGLETSFLNSDKTLENFKDIVNKSKQKGKFPSILDDIFKALSSNKGKFYPKSTATDMNNFIRTLSSKPNLLKWNVIGDTLVFPTKSNPSEKVAKSIIKTVMDKAGINYDLESKEVTNESNINETIDFGLTGKIYDVLVKEVPEVGKKYTKSAFSSLLDKNIK